MEIVTLIYRIKKPIILFLRKLKRIIIKINPLTEIGHPVAQIYICNKDFSSIFAINNFISFLSPLSDSAGKLILRIFTKDGKRSKKIILKLDKMQSEFLKVSDLLKTINIKSEMGIVSCRFVPNNLFQKDHKSLGITFPQPFLYYFNKLGSISLVHPLSIVARQKPSKKWISNQSIRCKNLNKIHLYQCNPSYRDHTTIFSLSDLSSGKVYQKKELFIPSMGVSQLTFDLNLLEDLDEFVSFQLSCNSLPSPNSKPMICREFDHQMMSMSHS